MPSHNYGSIVGAVRDRLRAEPRLLIGIDGKDGSGKTTLSGHLAAQLDLAVIHLDDFIEKHKGGYVEFLQRERLSSVLASRNAAVLVEGVCLLQLLGAVGHKPDFLIYVKRMSPHGWWQDERECDFAGSFKELVQLQRKEGMPRMPAPEREVVSYHLAHRPHRAADHIYHRVED